MMLYLYEDGYEGDNTFAKLIHRYSMSVPAAVANNRRRFFYEKMILNAVRSMNSPKITSVACGPAFEILELLRDEPVIGAAQFTCIDFEQEALSFLSNKIKEIEASADKSFNITLINRNITTLLSRKRMSEIISTQDLIYSSGLIDYFDDRLASKLIDVLFGFLNTGGSLVVGNVSSDNPSRGYMEFLGDWELNHRDRDQMISLASGLKEARDIRIELESQTGMNIFLIIEK